ncbi:MAG: heme exporter protein CcmD [Pseudomonadota bacterium]
MSGFLPDYGAHAPFVAGAWAASLVVIGALIARAISYSRRVEAEARAQNKDGA